MTRQTSDNTIKLQGRLVPVVNEASSDSTQAVSVDGETLQAALRSIHGKKVVYVSAPFAVSQGKGNDDGWYAGTCVPRCDYEKMQAGLSELKRFEEKYGGCSAFAAMLVGKTESR